MKSYEIKLLNKLQLRIAGGYGKPNGQTNYHKTIEYVDENGGTLAPGLLNVFPSNKYYHGCAMSMNNTHAMYTGGSYSSQHSSTYTLIINIYDGTTTNGPPLGYSLLRNHGCERFKHSNGTNYLILGKK